MRILLLLVAIGCGGTSPPAPIHNTAPNAEDPLAKLRTFEVNMCACLDTQGPAADEMCSSTAAEPVNAWVRDGTWQGTLTTPQITEATAILDRIRRCFQAGIGDPLPPRR